MTIKTEITVAPDAGMLSAMHKACFEKGWDAAAISEMLAIAGTEACIAHVEGEFAGFGLLRVLGEEAEILTLAVSKASRRQGAGAALVKSMLEKATAQGAKRFFLEVGERNEAAVRLYEKCGFSVISRRKSYYAKADATYEDALIMQCNLG